MPTAQLLQEGLGLALLGVSVVVGFLVLLVLATLVMSRCAAPRAAPAPGAEGASPGPEVDPRHLAAIAAAVRAHRRRNREGEGPGSDEDTAR